MWAAVIFIIVVIAIIGVVIGLFARTDEGGAPGKEHDPRQNEPHVQPTLAQESVLQMLESEDRSRSSQHATQTRIE